MSVTIRSAPAGARLSQRLSPQRLSAVDGLLAHTAAVAQAAQRSGTVMRAGGGGRFFELQAEGEVPPQEQPSPGADTGARLDAQQAQLTDHESRIARLEERVPAPAPDGGAANAPTEASAVAGQSGARMVDTVAIYARMNARIADPRAKAAAPPVPDVIQTAAGSMLDGAAIIARHNAFAAARVGRSVGR